MSVIESSQRDSSYYLEEIRRLRQFEGAPKDFWPQLLDALGHYALCQQLTLLSKDQEKNEWRRLGAWPRSALNLKRESPAIEAATSIAEQTLQQEIGRAHV